MLFSLYHHTSQKLGLGDIVGSWAQNEGVRKHPAQPNGRRRVTNVYSETKKRGGERSNQNIKCH